MSSLYLLAFLLTANHRDAERCFAAAVDEASKETAVFKAWTQSWIKRCLIRSAIQITAPVTVQNGGKKDPWAVGQDASPRDNGIDAVARLEPLERFVFVMTVLERYSAWDCSLLLGCSMQTVASTQVRALRRLPDSGAFFLSAEASQLDLLPVPA